MLVPRTVTERTVILVKALPQPSESHGETVCVAGLTPRGKWRRLYPIRFRHLKEKFKRWQWIDYRGHMPRQDRRKESRNVDEDSIKLVGQISKSERAKFLTLRIRKSVEEATAHSETLTIIRPRESNFYWKQKTSQEIVEQRACYVASAKQLSFLDKELKALDPCPYNFFFRYRSDDGKVHENFCHDWETSATFHNLSRRYGSDGALEHLKTIYNDHYPKAGMVFAMGTHSQRPDQWLLVGVIRLDEEIQGGLVV